MDSGATAVDRIRRLDDWLISPVAIYARFEAGITDAVPLFRELDAFLKAENYNGLTLQLDPKAHKSACLLLKRASQDYRLAMPEFTPDGDGGIDIEWERNGRRLVLSFKADQADTDFISWREGQGRYDGAPSSVELLKDRLDWLLG